MTDIAIDIDDVSVRYHDTLALKNATAQVPVGAICGLIGMNGAGKSTLFKAITDAAPLEKGKVRLAGRSVKDAQKRGIVAYVPQTEVIDWNFPVSVWDAVMMGRYGTMNFLRIPKEADYQAVEKALKKVGMAEYSDRQIGQLSGGQKKRVFVARALAQGATILLLDEPFAGVDARTERSLIQLLKTLQKQRITTLVAAHDLNTVDSYCDHMILMRGTVVAYGPTKKVFTKKNLERTYDGGAK